MITLFGATGYTGRLITDELKSLGLPPKSIRLAGRSPEKLVKLANSLDYPVELVAADATQPASLPALFKDTRVLINCAGPFTDLGEPVVALAAMHGCHYVDTTNELGFVHRMRSYRQLAINNQAAIIPACGFEIALADCTASLMGQQIESPLTSLDVIYALSGGNSSLGSRKSAIRSLGTSWLAFRNGEWASAVPCTRTRWVSLPQGLRAAISFPSSEISTVPTHTLTDQVNTWLVISRRSRHWAKTVIPMFAWLARSPLASIIAEISTRITKPPEADLRTEDRWLIQIEATSQTGGRTYTLTGKGVYEMTAKIAVYTAARLLEPGPTKFGVLSPSAVLEPRVFMDHAVHQWGCQIDPPLSSGSSVIPG
jgi:short subunit dehydrogenase-like uncharacterized protein